MTTRRPKTYKAALESGSKYYFTGRPCKNGHVCERRTSDRTCRSCARGRGGNWAKENKGKKNELSREWRARNPEHTAEYGSRWRTENPDKNRSKAAARRAAKMQRTPSWLSESDKYEIQCKYDEAERLTRETGTLHHVDHIIPLSGEFVSGLHVPANLQVLTAFANLSKGNRFNNINRRT